MEQTDYHDFLMATWKPAETEAILTALELGIFDSIDAGLHTAETLSKEQDYHLPTIKRILLILKNTEFLTEQAGNYFISARYSPYILKNSPLYNGEIWLLHQQLSRNLFGHLTEMAKTGKSGINVFAEKDTQVWESVMPFLDSLAKISAENIVSYFKQNLLKKDNLNILDLGCGTGVYTASLLVENATWHGIGIDNDKVIEIAKDKNKDLVEQDRFHFQSGDIFEDLPAVPKVDMIILSNVIHGYNYQETIDLIKNISRYLKPDGLIVVNEFLLTNPSDNLQSMFDLFFSLVGTGSSFTDSQLLEIFGAVGFDKVDEIDLKGPSTVYLFSKNS
ncbi:class I SAM-dependent methyltransferase [Enterococcus sp. AZ109]|uniref:class I SAM-dependent methyltransferase n=1 Tax=Enterococcus sp. AZ109 TaxID=2774634 RepID=UPI003F2961E5